MPPLPSLDWSEIVRVLQAVGWVHDRTKGSHYIMIRPNQPGLVSVPMHRPVKKGTLRSVLRQAGMSVAELIEHLES